MFLIVEDECRLSVHHYFATFHLAESVFVDFAVGADDGVFALRKRDGAKLVVGIEDDVDVVPLVASCVVLQAEGYETVLHGQEFQMLSHEVGSAETESWMVVAEVDEAAVVVKYLWVGCEIVPVDAVD